MKFLHLADLHLGKIIYGTSLIDSGDQREWVHRFLDLTRRTEPDAVVALAISSSHSGRSA